MYEKYDAVVNEIKFELGEAVASGSKFSVTLDEYTSIANHRFLDVNIHGVGKHWTWVMMRIRGSVDACRLVEELRDKLYKFGLDLKSHIVCVISGDNF